MTTSSVPGERPSCSPILVRLSDLFVRPCTLRVLRVSVFSEDQRRVRVQVRRREPTSGQLPHARRANHRGVVGRERQARDEHRKIQRGPASRSPPDAGWLLAETPPAMPTERAPCQRAAAKVRSTSVSTTRRWKLAAISLHLVVGQVGSPPSAACRARTWRSTAVLRPEKLKSNRPSRSGALRSGLVSRVPGHAIDRGLPVRGEAIDHRPSRIAQSQQLGHLVVGLARGIVAACGRGGRTHPRAARDRGWYARPTPPGPPPGAAPRHDPARLTRYGRRGDGRRPAACPRPRPRPWRRTHRPAAIPPARVPASRPWHRLPPTPMAASASARSTTPQMSRTCCREASSGTTPPQARWISTCDATMLEATAHGRARSPVSVTTAAAVSSHEVSMAAGRASDSARLESGIRDRGIGDRRSGINRRSAIDDS